MANYCQPKLEFSPDPLSVTTPTWVDVTSYAMSMSWANGTSSDLDQPQAGAATFTLKNTHRDFEPEYAGGRWAGNIVPLRRFRLSFTADGVSRPAGTWYATSYDLAYPDPGSTFSTVTVQCVDGHGVLALSALAALDPPTAESYSDVVTYDQPSLYWTLSDTSGRKMGAATGTEGQYKGDVTLNQPNPVLGDVGGAATFGTGKHYGRAFPDDVGAWHDSASVTMEAVVTYSGSGAHSILCGPETGGGTPIWQLAVDPSNQLAADVTTSGLTNAHATAALSAGSHHVAATYNGGLLSVYIDGALAATDSNGNNVATGGAGNDVKVGGQSLIVSTVPLTVSHAAVYDYALPAARVAAHATAALSRGYAQATAGTRIAALATHPLWSTAGIPAGQITVTPRMKTGQTAIDEIVLSVEAEMPIGLFYFDNNGNPAYQPFQPDTTIQAVFGDGPGEIPYDDFAPVYDDQLYNRSTVTRMGGLAQTTQDAASIAAYGARTQDADGLIIAYDADARLISQTITDRYSQPQKRISSITLNGSDQRARTQILTRQVGDTIRVTRRGEGGTTSVDVVTRILSASKSYDVHGDLRCEWTLSRGFPATPGVWRIGQAGYSEIGVTTVRG
jgi:hypothetical protein